MAMIQKFFRMPAADWEEVEKRAEQEERSASAIVRRAIKLYLASAYAESGPNPLTRAGLWFTTLPESVRPEVVRIGEALAAVELGETGADSPPPELPSTDFGTPADAGKMHTSPKARGRKKVVAKGKG